MNVFTPQELVLFIVTNVGFFYYPKLICVSLGPCGFLEA